MGNDVDVTDYEYDASGTLIKTVRKTNTDDTVEETDTTEYTYDEKGNLIKEVTTSSDGFSFTTTEYFDYKLYYNPNIRRNIGEISIDDYVFNSEKW